MAIKQDFVTKNTEATKKYNSYEDILTDISLNKIEIGDVCILNSVSYKAEYICSADIFNGTVFVYDRGFMETLQVGNKVKLKATSGATGIFTVKTLYGLDAFSPEEQIPSSLVGNGLELYSLEEETFVKEYVIDSNKKLKSLNELRHFKSISDIEAYAQTDIALPYEICALNVINEKKIIISTSNETLPEGGDLCHSIYCPSSKKGDLSIGDILEFKYLGNDQYIGQSTIIGIIDFGSVIVIQIQDYILPDDVSGVSIYKVTKEKIDELYSIKADKSIHKIDGVTKEITDTINNLSSQLATKAEKSQFFVSGTQTASTYIWKGKLHGVDKLYNGLVINYWLPYAGTSTSATLNLTLDDGTTTGAKNVYYGGTTRMTTHLPAQTVGQFVYLENHKLTPSATITYTGWWFLRSYLDGNTTYYVSTTGSLYTAGTNGIKQYSLFAENISGTYESFITNSGIGVKTWYTNGKFAFNPHILYNPGSSNIASTGRTGTTYPIYHAIDMRYNTSNVSTTTGMTTHKSIYMPVTIGNNGEYWSPAGDWTQTPTAGNYYLYIGNCYSSIYQATISEVHNVYYCNSDGKLVNWQTEFYKPRYVKPATHAEIMTVENSEMIMPDDVMHVSVKTYGWAGVTIYADFEDGTASTTMTDWYSGNVEIKVDKTTLYDEDTIILTMINYPPYGSESSAIGNMFHYPASKKPSIRVKKKGSESQEILVLHEKISGE